MGRSTTAPDPRPAVTAGDPALVTGGRCAACSYPTPELLDRCPDCGGPVGAACFGPEATVFSSTTVHIGPADLEPPYTLAYVDFDDGPRLLVHVADDGRPRPASGQRVRLLGVNRRGDPLVTAVRPS